MNANGADQRDQRSLEADQRKVIAGGHTTGHELLYFGSLCAVVGIATCFGLGALALSNTAARCRLMTIVVAR